MQSRNSADHVNAYRRGIGYFKDHVCRYGIPITIRSDRGTQFVNGIIKELLDLLQVEHEVSLAYSKEQNAIVERANREVMRHLTAIVFDKRVNDS